MSVLADKFTLLSEDNLNERPGRKAMKRIGILGGMSATSTQLYYASLCQLAQEDLGGLNSPELLIRSVNFDPIAKQMELGEWDSIAARLNREARDLETAGAEILMLATNTMHKLADQMMQGVNIPLVHIADATAEAIKAAGLSRPALLATKFTMQEPFYRERFAQHGLSTITPNDDDQVEINRIIFDELCRNEVLADSQAFYEAIAEKLIAEGADCVVLGCTEICLVLNDNNVDVPVFDTTDLHCRAAFEAANQG